MNAWFDVRRIMTGVHLVAGIQMRCIKEGLQPRFRSDACVIDSLDFFMR
jgi:hypothetical protein